MLMPPDDLPSRTALRDRDDRAAAEELRLVATKRQVAIVRTLADELERCLARGGPGKTVREQLVYELARLGRGSLEAAAAMSSTAVIAEDRSSVQRCRG